MAKYTLSRSTAGIKTINCAVLDENCLANTYTVQFDNGIIRNVSKSRVKDLDALDEGVLDRLKEVGKKLKDTFIATAAGGAMIIGGLTIPASVVNMDACARTNDFMEYFSPGAGAAEAAESAGGELHLVEEDDHEEDETFIDNANDLLGFICDLHARWEKGEVTDEELEEWADAVDKMNEDAFAPFVGRAGSVSESLCEAAGDGVPTLHVGGLPTLSTKSFIDKIVSQYQDCCELFSDKLGTENPDADEDEDDRRYTFGDIADMRKEQEAKYMMLWGAPGVGKSQIVSSSAKQIKKRTGNKVTICTVNALGLLKDDLALPTIGTMKNKTAYVNSNGDTYAATWENSVPKDVLKAWLPCWNAATVKEIAAKYPDWDELSIAIELDNVANGGRMAIPSYTDEEGRTVPAQERIEGHGGIIFIDELSRIAPDVMNELMTLVQTREINGNYLGSKWIFVAAGNRHGDMAKVIKSEAIKGWEKAFNDRFEHYSYAPTFEEWCEWARAGHPQHIHPKIMRYLQNHPDSWYAPNLAYNDREENVFDETDPISGQKLLVTEASAKFLFPNPRAWHDASKALYAEQRAAYRAGRGMDAGKVKGALRGNVGDKATKDFIEKTNGVDNFMDNEAAKFIIDYPPKQAVGEMGVSICDRLEFLGIDRDKGANGALGYIENVLSQDPDYSKQKNLTPEQFENIAGYLSLCGAAIIHNGDKGSAQSVVAQAIKALRGMIDRVYGTGKTDELLADGRYARGRLILQSITEMPDKLLAGELD